jgi:hypothetical protein
VLAIRPSINLQKEGDDGERGGVPVVIPHPLLYSPCLNLPASNFYGEGGGELYQLLPPPPLHAFYPFPFGGERWRGGSTLYLREHEYSSKQLEEIFPQPCGLG